MSVPFTPSDFLTYLKTIEPASSFLVQPLTGGLVNVTVRATRILPSSASTSRSYPTTESPFASYNTFILKQAPPYVAAVGPSAPFSTFRQTIEARALRLLERYSSCLQGDHGVKVPKLIHHDDQNHILAITDLGDDLLTIDKWLQSSPPPDDNLVETVGRSVGTFMASFHQIPAESEELDSLENHSSGDFIQKEVVDRMAGIMDRFKVAKEEAGPLVQLIVDSKLMSHEDSEGQQVLCVGDFWIGSVLANPSGTSIAVVDFEFAGRGRALQDMAQFGSYFNTVHSGSAPAVNPYSRFIIAANRAHGKHTRFQRSQPQHHTLYTLKTIRDAWVLHGREVLSAAADSDNSHPGVQGEEGRRRMAEVGLWYLRGALSMSFTQRRKEEDEGKWQQLLDDEKILKELYC